MRAWQALTDIGALEPWEVKALVQLGMMRAAIQSEKSNDEARRRREVPQTPFAGSTAIPRHRSNLLLPRRR